MQTTLTEMRRETKRVVRALGRGESVTVTEHGRAIGNIRPAAPRRRVSIAEFRKLELSDASILEAINESRE